jgi:FkbM family methyltransferase
MARLVNPTGQVYAFEPVPAIYDELVRNVKLNDFQHVQCVRKAVSDRVGSERFITGHHAGAGHLATAGRGGPAPDASAASYDVELTTLDEFVRQGGKPPTFIKVDVEGAEGSVLRGAQAILSEHRPVMLIELHTPEQDVIVGSLLKDAGYTARRVDSTAPPVVTMTSGWPDPNGLWGQILAVPVEKDGVRG